MTTHDEQQENNSSNPVEPKIEYIGIGRGSYSALSDTADSLKSFERFLDPERGSMPDIDGNFVNGDKVHAETMESLREKSLNPESSVLDGYSDKEDIIRAAREAEDDVRIRNVKSVEWFNRTIGTNHFFR